MIFVDNIVMSGKLPFPDQNSICQAKYGLAPLKRIHQMNILYLT